MSSTVEIYVADPADAVSLARRVAVALDMRGYFSPGEIFILPLDARPWIGAEGVGQLFLDRTDCEPEDRDEIAFAPYGYELSLEFKSGPAQARAELRKRFGRAVFDRLRVLDRPLALGDESRIYADFLPGHGVRDFEAGVSFTESGRSRWYEPRLHDHRPDAAQAPGTPSGEVTVFEAGGLLHFVPQSGAGEPITPVTSVRATVGAPMLGRRVLAEALHRSGAPGNGDPFPWIHEMAQMTADEYARAAISIDVRVEENAVSALPHGGYVGEPVGGVVQGPGVEPLAVRESGPWDDEAIGRLLLRLISAVRDHAYA